MKNRNLSRVSLIVLGLMACAVILVAGGYDLRLIHQDQASFKGGRCADPLHTAERHADSHCVDSLVSAADCADARHSDERHQQGQCSDTFVSALQDAVPGSPVTTILECPPYKLVVEEDREDTFSLGEPVTEVVVDYLHPLVRSLLRPNAP